MCIARALASILVGLFVAPVGAMGGTIEDWDPRMFSESETIEIRTISNEEGEYWFPVWVVVIEDKVFVRLGSRAAERIKFNRTFPDIGVRVGDLEFERVHAEPASTYVERVAGAMADKYWSDLFIRWLAHPLTLELRPAKSTGKKPAASGA